MPCLVIVSICDYVEAECLVPGKISENFIDHQYGYSKNQCLKPGQVEVLLFRRYETGSPGIKARTIEVSETGFEIETIDKVVKDLNDSSQDIYFTLFD